MKSLIIVESPTKAKTIQKFLGNGFKILSSFGHIRDLPKRELGVDIENNFEPKYVIPPKAKKVLKNLKEESEKADNTILATDEDREGESISWHLQEALKLKNPKRIVFHEITEGAIKKALETPRVIDMKMVNAQQARRILDRIVGYKLSPFLWKKVAKGLSAGRVQSVALRLIVDREKEIEAFKPVEYWSIEALLNKNNKQFTAKLLKDDLKNENDANKVLQDLNGAEYIVKSIEKKETKRYPAPPFTTSTLQQAAFQRFKFSAKMTMSLAQRLYEEGHITYHRTDSLNLSEMSLNSAKDFILQNYGQNYWTGKSTHFKTKSASAQEAHEAIRPTFADKTPKILSNIDSRQLKLYTLIWERFIACQMTPAIFDSISAEINANNYKFKANGQTLKFDGYLKAYPAKFEQTELPELKQEDKLNLLKLNSTQHFTEPPARYNEASLVKALEKNGIGRPSTYATIISTLQDKNYVSKDNQKRFIPSEMGTIVNDVLVKNFPEIVDINFTANLEKELDEVSDGKDTWQKTCKDFYIPFSKNLSEKYNTIKKTDLVQKTDKTCPKCKGQIVERLGRFGKFYACSNFPECKYTESVEGDPDTLNINCPKCKQGKITGKRTKKGKTFYGCDKYPKCDFAVWDKPVNEFCKDCGSILVEKLSRTKTKILKCSNKTCKYIKDNG
jgi:DNA topoisomerase-1